MSNKSGIKMEIEPEMDFKTKKKEVYLPLRKIIKEIMKALKELELNIPIAKLARMDLAGVFKDESLNDFKKTVYDYMRVVNKYRQLYFDFMNNTKILFDREMTKDGSFAQGFKQYDSIRSQVGEAILKSDGKAWIMSYDQYLPAIRERATKRAIQPRTGKKMYNDLKNMSKNEIKSIRDLQKLSFQLSKLFLNDINYALKNPELKWQEWLTDNRFAKVKSKLKNYK